MTNKNYWFFDLGVPDPGTVAAASGSPSAASGGCAQSPCFVCELRATAMEALERSNRLPSQYKGKARAAPTPGVVAPVLEIVLVGLRLENTVSNSFDDRMAILFRLPKGEGEVKAIKDAVEQDLLDAWTRAVESTDNKPRVITCSSGSYVAALVSITTDPGFATEERDALAKLKKLDGDLQANAEKQKKARERLQALDTEIPAAQSRMDSAGTEKKAAQADLADLRKQTPHASASDLSSAQKRVKDATDAFVKASKDLQKLQAEQKALNAPKAGKIALLEAEKETIEKKTKPPLEKQAKAAAQESSPVPWREGSWYEDLRGMMRPGHYPSYYRFYLHKTADTKSFAKDTSLPALTVVTSVPGMRVASKAFLKANPKYLAPYNKKAPVSHGLGANPVVGEIHPAGGEIRKFVSDEATLVYTDEKHSDLVVRVSSPKADIPIADGDLLFIQANVDGTNLHRAHSAKLLGGVLLGEAGTDEVNDWSEGCQTFPRALDFNVFIRTCAVSKRWLCASKEQVGKGEAKCKRLQKGSGQELSEGEKAVRNHFEAAGIDVDKAADINRSGKRRPNGTVVGTQIEDIAGLQWTDGNQERLAALQSKKASLEEKQKKLSKQEADELKKLEDKQAKGSSEEGKKKLAELEKSRAAWRLDYLREKTERLGADYMRLCDVNEQCEVRFTYTLAEVNPLEMKRIDDLFQSNLNKPWNGKLE